MERSRNEGAAVFRLDPGAVCAYGGCACIGPRLTCTCFRFSPPHHSSHYRTYHFRSQTYQQPIDLYSYSLLLFFHTYVSNLGLVLVNQLFGLLALSFYSYVSLSLFLFLFSFFILSLLCFFFILFNIIV